MAADHAGAPIWTPSPERRAESEISRYLGWLAQNRALTFGSYEDLHRWSVDDLSGFWGSLWDYFRIEASAPPEQVLDRLEMPGAHWFQGARLNYAANALSAPGAREALVGVSEDGDVRRVTYSELGALVAAAAAGLRQLGVEPGDRVAAYLPSVVEAVVVLLASASVGAVFCLCPPEFGATGALARLQTVGPKVLIAADGYRYGGREHSRLEVVSRVCRQLPGLRQLVVVPILGREALPEAGVPTLGWDDFLCPGAGQEHRQLPFEHPLWVLFSSGTTGRPKAIVHGHGGVVLEHLKSLALHRDVRDGDRVLWLTSAGWMMWNYIVGGLLRGATIVLLDGSPAFPDLGRAWGVASSEGVSLLGAGAAFLEACRRSGLQPRASWGLEGLRSLGSTGSALSGAAYDWAYRAVGSDIMLSPASGGTDVCSAFLGPCPMLPLWREEMQCRMLGASVEAYDPSGSPVRDQVGELVVTRPMPTMPLYLWGDSDGSRLRQSYFAHFPGVWRHGDWVVLSSRGGARVLGRSDATLNRGGVRMGSEEFYAALAQVQGVSDSLIVNLDGAGEGGLLLLLVAPAAGHPWSAGSAELIRSHLRSELSPRHVPDLVLPLRSLPRTLSGKRMEVPVKRILSGVPVAQALDPDTVADPGALEAIVELSRTRPWLRPGPGIP